MSLAEGEDATCTITNTAIEPRLTLVKTVINNSGGTAVPTDWILTAAGPTTVTGRTGEAAVTAAVVPMGQYQLSESGGDPGYDASPWVCTGNATPVTAGGRLDVGVGEDVTCTITNTDQPATLTLAKVVDAGGSGSGKVPADWTLTATPVGIPGQPPVSGNGDPTSPGGVNAVTVQAGSYDLSESGPAGFTPGTWICQGGVVTGTRVAVPVHGTVVCQITNQAVAPTLTLVKVVDNGTTGATAVPTDWTLSAAGPTPISGVTGAATVTNAPVHVGTYTLGESGPPGYTAGAWTCQGGTAVAARDHPGRGPGRDVHDHEHRDARRVGADQAGQPAVGHDGRPRRDDHLHARRRPRERRAVSGATATDDLSKVLPFATVVTPLPSGLTMVGSMITWAIPTIPVGGSVQVSFSVTLHADAGGATVFNSAAPGTPDGHCTPCEAEHAVRATAVVPPVNPTVPPEPPSIPSAGTGTDVVGPLRWSTIFLTSGTLLLITTLRRRSRLRRPRPA